MLDSRPFVALERGSKSRVGAGFRRRDFPLAEFVRHLVLRSEPYEGRNIVSVSAETAMPQEPRRTVETPIEARQGFLDRPILVVLVVSLSIAVVVLALVYRGFFGAS